MQVQAVLNHQIIVLALMMAVGFIAGKAGVIDRDGRAMISKVILNITFASLLFTTIPNFKIEQRVWGNIGLMLILAPLILSGLLGVGLFLGKLSRLSTDTRKVYALQHTIGNVVFLAFPLLKAIYGDHGIIYGAFFNLANDAILWSVGVYLVKAGKAKFSFRDLTHLFNINLIAFLAGLALLLMGIRLEGIIFEVLDPIGKSTFVLSMLFIGANLSEAKLADFWQQKSSYLLAVSKLIVCPLLIGAVLYLLNIKSIAAQIAILQAAMPTSVTVTLVAHEHGRDITFATRIVVISTLLSLVTLPLIVYLLNLYF